jgi:cell division inhibitor SepF
MIRVDVPTPVEPDAREDRMDSMWRRAMLYLGLGPDEQYEDYDGADERVAPAAPPARAAAPVRETAGVSARPAPGRPRPSAPPAPEPEPSAVRPLPGVSGDATPKPRTVVRPVPATSNAKPHVVVPSSFNQAQDVADKFKGSQPVILNLQAVDRDLSRRLIDFSSGLCYGLGGQMEKVAHQVYLLTPSNVEVSVEERRRLSERGLHDA